MKTSKKPSKTSGAKHSSNILLITSSGDRASHEIAELARKDAVGWKIVDARDAFEDDKLFDECRELGLKTFPILVVNGHPARFTAVSDNPRDSYDAAKKIVERETLL